MLSDTLDRLLTTQQAAEVMSVCEKTISNLVRSGALSCVRIGRAVRFDRADLRNWIEAQKTRAPQSSPNGDGNLLVVSTQRW